MEDEVGQIVVGIENKNGENRPGPIIPLHGEEYRRSVYIFATLSGLVPGRASRHASQGDLLLVRHHREHSRN